MVPEPFRHMPRFRFFYGGRGGGRVTLMYFIKDQPINRLMVAMANNSNANFVHCIEIGCHKVQRNNIYIFDHNKVLLTVYPLM